MKTPIAIAALMGYTDAATCQRLSMTKYSNSDCSSPLNAETVEFQAFLNNPQSATCIRWLTTVGSGWFDCTGTNTVTYNRYTTSNNCDTSTTNTPFTYTADNTCRQVPGRTDQWYKMGTYPAPPTTGGSCGATAEMFIEPSCTQKYTDGTAWLNFIPSLSNGACMDRYLTSSQQTMCNFQQITMRPFVNTQQCTGEADKQSTFLYNQCYQVPTTWFQGQITGADNRYVKFTWRDNTPSFSAMYGNCNMTATAYTNSQCSQAYGNATQQGVKVQYVGGANNNGCRALSPTTSMQFKCTPTSFQVQNYGWSNACSGQTLGALNTYPINTCQNDGQGAFMKINYSSKGWNNTALMLDETDLEATVY